VWWHFRRTGWAPGDPEYVDPVTVVADTDEQLVTWLAPGTPRVVGRRVDGRGLRDDPATQFTAPRVQGRAVWEGQGSLRVSRCGEPWTVCLFWSSEWVLDCWYVNLEDPYVRDGRHLYTRDHLLDVIVAPDRTCLRKDEDELARAVDQGFVSADDAVAIEAAATAAEERVAAWASPFADGWEDWRPDPTWPLPGLPDAAASQQLSASPRPRGA
jgi:hypothetical protein